MDWEDLKRTAAYGNTITRVFLQTSCLALFLELDKQEGQSLMGAEEEQGDMWQSNLESLSTSWT